MEFKLKKSIGYKHEKLLTGSCFHGFLHVYAFLELRGLLL